MPYLVGAGWGYEALEISTIVDTVIQGQSYYGYEALEISTIVDA
jgi:hypothetical protein